MIRTVTRIGSDSRKWGKYHHADDVIPLWIADTDFVADKAILDALHTRIEHGILGYGQTTEDFRHAVVTYLAKQYQWTIDPEWICPVPGVVPGLNITRAISIARGKHAALTVSPTYPHLRNHPPVLDFQPQFVEVIDNGDTQWHLDFDALESRITTQTGLLLLCHPHNPIGKIYTERELNAFADIARRHDLIVCSDEIHCDLILNGTVHRPFATLNDDALERTITMMAPSKTYNIAGLCCAFAIVADPDLRHAFTNQCIGLTGDVNIMGMHAAIAAYTAADAWREQMLIVLRQNAEMVYNAINTMPYLSMKPVQATFLAWIDARRLPVEHPQRFFEQAGVGLSDGSDYGWPGFVRLNFGCSTALLEKALQRIADAVNHV